MCAVGAISDVGVISVGYLWHLCAFWTLHPFKKPSLLPNAHQDYCYIFLCGSAELGVCMCQQSLLLLLHVRGAGGWQGSCEPAVWLPEPVGSAAYHLVQQQLHGSGVATESQHAARLEGRAPRQELQVGENY